MASVVYSCVVLGLGPHLRKKGSIKICHNFIWFFPFEVSEGRECAAQSHWELGSTCILIIIIIWQRLSDRESHSWIVLTRTFLNYLRCCPMDRLFSSENRPRTATSTEHYASQEHLYILHNLFYALSWRFYFCLVIYLDLDLYFAFQLYSIVCNKYLKQQNTICIKRSLT